MRVLPTLQIAAYDLSFDVNFHDLGFVCHEVIHVENPEKQILLDSLGLTISRVSVDGNPWTSYRQDEQASRLIIDDLPEEPRIRIEIDFSGKVSEESLHGLYKSRYKSGYVLATDLEPNGARRVFPCIDDPSFKAVFNVQVTTGKDLAVIANTPLLRSEDGEGGDKKRFVFEKTPRMSTYLFFLGIGPFDQLSKIDGKTEFIVASSPGQSRKGKFALDNAARFLRNYEEYYSIPYPLRKLHLIGLPEYASGAMENWGAITFREVALFVDENSSVADKRRATVVLGHELAHQWFGNLVTMKWWNDLWLNESFATFLEPKMTSKLYPDWNILSDFLQKLTAHSMLADSLSSTHPIDVRVKSPEEIAQIFDEISYGKGASVLRMVEGFLGEEAFRVGVTNYLREFRFANAEGKDLWRHLERASKHPVSNIMEAWIKKPGYPVVEASYEENNRRITLQQRRFFLRGNDTVGDSSTSSSWPIPITMNVNGEMRNLILESKSQDIVLQSKLDRLKINTDQTGFYRVLYDEKLYELIETQFEHLSPFDRWGILTDLFAFLLADYAKLDAYLRFARKCYNENDYLIVDSLIDQLRLLKLIAPSNNDLNEVYETYLRSQARRLGLESKEGERETDSILRGKIVQNLAMIDDSEFAGEKLAGKFEGYENVDPNIRTAVAVAYARQYGEQAFDTMVSMMKRIGDEAEVIKISNGLVSSRDPKLIRKALDLSISGEINRADAVYTIINASLNPVAGEITWNWLKDNLIKLKEIFTGTYIVSYVLQEGIPIAGLGRERDLKEYISKANVQEASAGVAKGLEFLEIYSAARKRLGN